MRDYGKIHSSFWSSETIRSLTDDGRMLALYLMTSPHTTISGTFRLPDGYACEDLQWSAVRVTEGFVELFRKGFANRCETTKWVWICKHLEWNPPENPNQFKAAWKVISTIPAECAWRSHFLAFCANLKGLDVTPVSNPLPTLPKPLLNQKQEQEQEQKKEQEGKKPRKAGLPPDFKLTQSLAAYVTATIPDADPASMFADFCDKAASKGWMYADWDRAFQTFVRGAKPGSGHFSAGVYPKKLGVTGENKWQ